MVNDPAPAPITASAFPDADTAFTPPRAAAPTSTDPPPQTRLDVRLRVLHVQVPRAQRAKADAIWDSLREDVLDSGTRSRLERNGIRVGAGRIERWDAIQAALNAIDGNRVHELPPVRTPPDVPLFLELDSQPRDQTVFYMDGDGILSGDTWQASQRVLRVTYTLDIRDLNRVYLTIVPEIRRELGAGPAYVDGNWTLGTQRTGRAFAAAALVVPVSPNDFAVLAPGEKADVFGLVGRVFWTDKIEDQPYDSYVFLRADVAHVDQRR